MKVWEALEILTELAEDDEIFVELDQYPAGRLEKIETGRHPKGTARVVYMKGETE